MRKEIVERVSKTRNLYHLKSTLYYVFTPLRFRIPIRTIRNAYSRFYDEKFIQNTLKSMTREVRGNLTNVTVYHAH